VPLVLRHKAQRSPGHKRNVGKPHNQSAYLRTWWSGCLHAFEELLKAVAERLGKAPILFSLPFLIWRSLARVAEMLPEPPLSCNQVELVEVDTVASAGVPGFGALGIAPQPIEQHRQSNSCKTVDGSAPFT
jgi:hypothetical protein